MNRYLPSNGENERVAISFPDRGITLDRWKEYVFLSHFLTGADGWSFTTSPWNDASRAFMRSLSPGERVQLRLNGVVQMTGFIDVVEWNSSRVGGVELRIEGRDALGQVVDTGMDPNFHVKEGASLGSVIMQVFAPFGWTSEDQFILAEEAEESALSTAITGKKTSKKGKPLESFKLHQHTSRCLAKEPSSLRAGSRIDRDSGSG